MSNNSNTLKTKTSELHFKLWSSWIHNQLPVNQGTFIQWDIYYKSDIKRIRQFLMDRFGRELEVYIKEINTFIKGFHLRTV